MTAISTEADVETSTPARPGGAARITLIGICLLAGVLYAWQLGSLHGWVVITSRPGSH